MLWFTWCLEKLSWKADSVKIAVLIADAPAHGLGISYDSMPDGCPLKTDCAGCEPSLNPYRQFFISLCLMTGGKHVSLNDVNNLTNVIIGGTREKILMEKAIANLLKQKKMLNSIFNLKNKNFLIKIFLWLKKIEKFSIIQKHYGEQKSFGIKIH